VDGEVDGIGAKLAAPCIPAEKGDRHSTVQQDDRLREPIDLHVSSLPASLIIDPQIHARIQVADLLGVTVEQQCRSAA
jgi:hypothetical protein